MLNATPNSRSSGRMLLSSRVSSRSSTSSDEGSGRSEAPVQRGRQLPPLTPSNTFSDYAAYHDSDSPAASDDRQSFFDDGWDIGAFRKDLLQRMDPTNDNEDDCFFDDTRSEPLPDRRSPSSDRTVIHSRPDDLQRSSSVPVRPPKIATARSPPPSRASISIYNERKKPHFDENDPSVVPILYSTNQSSHAGDSSSSEYPKGYCRQGYLSREADEVGDALGVFEDVLEELVQAAEEHAEAHEQLMGVARDVADAIFETRMQECSTKERERGRARNRKYEDDGEDSDDVLMSPRFSDRVSADDDIDESCMEDAYAELSEIDSEALKKGSFGTTKAQRSLPEVVFLTASGEIKKPGLEPILEESTGSSEAMTGPNDRTSRVQTQRRLSVPASRVATLDRFTQVPRRASMTDVAKVDRKFKLLPFASKADPAGCAVSACTVRAAESPKLNTVYQHPGVRYKSLDTEKRHTKTAHTIRSNSGIYQMVWVEPPASASSSEVSLVESSGDVANPTVCDEDNENVTAPSPMDKVKTKLAAWNWEREHGFESHGAKSQWIPLLSVEEDEHSRRSSGKQTPMIEEPWGPPNTERQSGTSSAKHSAPPSPRPETDRLAEPDDDEDQPLELKVKATFSRSRSLYASNADNIGSDYLILTPEYSRSVQSSPGVSARQSKAVSRQLSNLAAEDAHFKTHKDSLVLMHRWQEEGKMNQHLMNSQDSIVLTRSKFDDRYPRSAVAIRPTRSRAEALLTIPDASPPDSRVQFGVETMTRVVEGDGSREPPLSRSSDKAHAYEYAG